jgi:hypothetical protein
MSRFGIDYAWHNTVTDAVAKELVKAGVTFVGRYYSNNNDSKNLSPGEVKALSKHDIDIVCFWESTATEAENGYAAGVADAKRALVEAKEDGMPSDRPIYFAIDEDATVGPHITAYFKGVASVIGLKRTGVYGGIRVVRGLFDARLIEWAFQTYAWSGGKWDARAQFRQYSNGHTVAGISCDYDTAVAKDFGQWRVGHDPGRAPAKPPAKKPPAKKPSKPVPPRDLCGVWPWGAHDFIGTTEPRNPLCHSGVLAKDHAKVRAWQKQMKERGWTLDVSGVYDERSEQVCREFQRQKHIVVTGKVNHPTWHHARFDPVTK